MSRVNTIKNNYTLKSSRLGFRQWLASDLGSLAAMNQNQSVMRFFPRTLNKEESNTSLIKMQKHISTYGFGYFAVDLLQSGEFVGLIGLQHQDFKSSFTPCIDIGWRLLPQAWGKGYATEGALACLKFGFDEFHLNKIYSIAPQANISSIKVMERIGMQKESNFNHPKLALQSPLNPFCVYSILRSRFTTPPTAHQPKR